MFKLEKLPFDLGALEPFISKEIMDLHYNKHHLGYLNKLNKIIEDYNPSLFNIDQNILPNYINAFPISIRSNLKNQLGGHLNHSFFWELISKKDTNLFKIKVELFFKDSFGSFDIALENFKELAISHFGSGWVWFCYNWLSQKIEIRTYNNQDCPLFDNLFPILGIDLWEHAYYLQYKNNKNEYIENFLRIINWENVFNIINMCQKENNIFKIK
jgi:Fe-Mn family superoxide dismutase